AKAPARREARPKGRQTLERGALQGAQQSRAGPLGHGIAGRKHAATLTSPAQSAPDRSASPARARQNPSVPQTRLSRSGCAPARRAVVRSAAPDLPELEPSSVAGRREPSGLLYRRL